MVGEATARAKPDGGIWAYWLVRGPYHQYASGIWGTELLHITHTHILSIHIYSWMIFDVRSSIANIFFGGLMAI